MYVESKGPAAANTERTWPYIGARSSATCVLFLTLLLCVAAEDVRCADVDCVIHHVILPGCGRRGEGRGTVTVQ
jgi:hypothetical protein